MNLRKKLGAELMINTIVIAIIILLVAIVLISFFNSRSALTRILLNKSINETKEEGEIALKELNQYIQKELKEKELFSLRFGEEGVFEYNKENYSVSFSCLKEIKDSAGHLDCELLKATIKDKNKKIVDCNNSKDFVIKLHETECCKNTGLNVCFYILQADLKQNSVDYKYFDLCDKGLSNIMLKKPKEDTITICWDLGSNKKQPYTIVWKSRNKAYAAENCFMSSGIFGSDEYINFEIINPYEKKTIGYCSIRDNKIKTCTYKFPFTFHILAGKKCEYVEFNIDKDKGETKLGKECNKEDLNC